MRTLALLAALLAAPAIAGESYLGTLVSGAGADITNGTTATPFAVPTGSKLTFNCTAAAVVCIDTATACAVGGTTNPGIPVAALVNFPTSTANWFSAPTITVGGKTSAIIRIAGAAATTCTVWSRNGNE